MTSIILKDASVVLNSVDLSAQVASVTLNLGRNMEDGACMGDDTERNVPAIKNWSADIEFKQSFAAGEVDATLFPLYDAGTVFTMVVKPTSGAVSATNPSYTASAVISSYPPIAGSHGSLQKATVSLVPGGGNLVRATA